jgi:hypothetical protein
MKPEPFILAVILSLCPAAAQAQIRIGIDIPLPPVPHLVVIAPGVQVVEGSDEEVFFQGGWYWCRRPDGWYRSRSPRSHFDWVDYHRVPGGLTRIPAGRYHNWHHDEGRPMGHERDHEMGHEMDRHRPGERRDDHYRP